MAGRRRIRRKRRRDKQRSKNPRAVRPHNKVAGRTGAIERKRRAAARAEAKKRRRPDDGPGRGSP